MKRRTLVITLISISPLAMACQKVSSADVKTSGLYANISAEAKGDGSTLVSATLRVGGALSNTFLDLTSDEKISASSGTDQKTLARKSFLGAVSYEATFTGDELDKSFTVSLERPTDYVSAPNTQLSMPAGFTISAPTGGTSFSRANDDIVVTWDNNGSSDDMQWELATSNCARESKTNAIPSDSGSFTIPKGTLVAIQGHEGETCDTSLWLVRRRLGSLDPNFGDGGFVVARQVRKVVISSTP